MANRKTLAQFLIVALVALSASIVLACNGDEEAGGSATPTVEGSPPPQESPTAAPETQLCARTVAPADEVNVLINAGFEEGGDPWFALKPPEFELSDVARSGQSSAYLKMREPPESAGAKVFYLVQEVKPTKFPEVISGYYRVDNWVRGTPKQYLQFVVIVSGAANRPPEFPNHQIRYLLAGIQEDPFVINNAKFVYLTKAEPKQGEWVPFKVNVKQDFLDLWGAVPENFDCIRLLFEVRYDEKIPGSGTPEADVYYDDLHFGPAADASVP